MAKGQVRSTKEKKKPKQVKPKTGAPLSPFSAGQGKSTPPSDAKK
jgi:hypothetical protein